MYFIADNKVNYGQVENIEIFVRRSADPGVYYTIYNNKGRHAEQKLFATKEELLASL